MSKKLPTPKEQPVVITVAMPCHDMCQSLWAHDLAGMLTYTVACLGDKIGIRILMIQNTYIQKARENLVETALDQGTHYVLFVDSDMRFPKEALVTLLAHDVDVVGVNYSTRGFPPQFVAIKSRKIPEEYLHGSQHSLRANRHPTLADSTGARLTAMDLQSLQFRADPVSPQTIRFGYRTVNNVNNLVDIETAVSLRN